MTKQAYDVEVDCQGLLCPLPVLKAKQAMDPLSPGHVLRLLASDSGSVHDIPAWAQQTGNRLLGHSTENGTYIYYLRKT